MKALVCALLLGLSITGAQSQPLPLIDTHSHFQSGPGRDFKALRPNRLNPSVLQSNSAAFKALLAHNPRTRFIWSHVGFEPLLTRQPQEVRQFLREFPNLSMSFRLNNGTPNPASALGPDRRVKAAWVNLVTEFPDRFMLGSDAF